MTPQNKNAGTRVSQSKSARIDSRADGELGLAIMRGKLRRAFVKWKSESDGADVNGGGAQKHPNAVHIR